MGKSGKSLRREDTPVYSYWQSLFRAFYSPALYVDVVKRWRGAGALYLLFILALALIPFGIRLSIDIHNYFKEEVIAPFEKLPKIYVQNGRIIINKPMPYLVKNNKGHVVAIVDTTGGITGFSQQYPHLHLLITKDSIIYRAPKPQLYFSKIQSRHGKISVEKIPEDASEVIVVKEWLTRSGVKNIILIEKILLYPLLLTFFYVIYLILLLTISMLGQLVAKVLFNTHLTYLQSCRALAVASTPQVFFLFITIALNAMFSQIFFVQIVLLSIYFCYAVISVKHHRTQMVLR